MKHRRSRTASLCVILLLSLLLGGCGEMKPAASLVPQVDAFELSAPSAAEVTPPAAAESSIADSSADSSLAALSGTSESSTGCTQPGSSANRSTTRGTTHSHTTQRSSAEQKPAPIRYTPVQPKTPMRAVWLSYFELPKTNGLDETGYHALAEQTMKNISDAGLNTVFLHVRAFSDAIYPSALFPWSKYILGSGAVPDYDPLSVLLAAAHKYKLSCHAWLNPFRAASDPNPANMAMGNPARDFLEDKDKSNDSYVYQYSGGIYLNPAALPAQKLILDGVREIAAKYPVDGIHIDDYFYPVTSADIDRVQYGAYCQKGGQLSLAQWRRSTVSAFVMAMNQAAKSKNSAMLFSISPAGNISLNYNDLYADVALWASTPGYADLLIPQLYFGFEHESLPFEKALSQWTALTQESRIPLAFGLAAYKIGKTDSYAGTGSREWIAKKDVLPRQMKRVLALPKTGGFALFSYSSLFGKSAPEELLSQIRVVE